jgi:hypothetical protein
MRPIHAMQGTRLVAARIAHISQIQPKSHSLLESFHRTLVDERFRVEVRRTGVETIEEIQGVLDGYREGYNTRRPHQERGMNGRTPIRAFTEGIPKTSNTEVTSQTKTAKLKAA